MRVPFKYRHPIRSRRINRAIDEWFVERYKEVVEEASRRTMNIVLYGSPDGPPPGWQPREFKGLRSFIETTES